MKQKHPKGKPAHESVLLANTPEEMHPTKFESISAESIWKAAIKTKGGLGPSDMDAVEWRIIISKKFRESSNDFCSALANVTKKIYAKNIPPLV